MRYGTLELSELAKVTPRQLQWWDETGVISPHKNGHLRSYRPYEALAVLIASELRRKGLSLQRTRNVMEAVWERIPRIWNDKWMVILDDTTMFGSRDSAALSILKDAKGSSMLLSIKDIADKLKTHKPKWSIP